MVTLGLPPNELRANRRSGQHWAAKVTDEFGRKHSLNAIKTEYMNQCLTLLHNQGYRGSNIFWLSDGPWHVTVTIYLAKGQRVDPSDVGFWIKVPIDAMVKARVFPNDSAAWLNPFTVEVKRDPANPRLEISW